MENSNNDFIKELLNNFICKNWFEKPRSLD